jgi:hypothetical protein
MLHRSFRFWGSTAVLAAVAATMIGFAAISTSSTFHSAKPAAVIQVALMHAVVKPVAKPAATPAKPAARPAAAEPDSALARAFRRYFHQQAVSGMTAWIKTGIEQRNQAILIQARGDAFPERDAALPADSRALEASAKEGLASPSPEDKAGWDKIMRDEITIAQELPVVSEGNAASAEAPVIEQDYLAFAQATS